MSNYSNSYEVLLNKNDDSNINNILKNKTTLSLHDYQKIELEKQYNKLYENSIIVNNAAIDEKEQLRVYNLSLKTLAKNTSQTCIDLLNDLSMFLKKKDKTWNGFVYILVKDDRLIYIGIILVIISILLYMIGVTE